MIRYANHIGSQFQAGLKRRACWAKIFPSKSRLRRRRNSSSAVWDFWSRNLRMSEMVRTLRMPIWQLLNFGPIRMVGCHREPVLFWN